MLRITVGGKEIDLYENESVNVTRQFQDVRDINSPVSSFTQTFRVPATHNNLQAFGAVNIPDISGMNLKQKFDAILMRDSLPIMEGGIQVKSVHLQKENYADLELAFFGEAVDLKASIGDAMLSDLDTSANDHTLNKGNILASWTDSGIGPEFRYGLVDRGENWSFPDNPPWSSTDGLWQGEMTLFVQAYYLFTRILFEAGFSWNSTFLLSDNFADIYMPALSNVEGTTGDEELEQRARVGLPSDYTGSTFAKLGLSTGADDSINNGTNWNDSNDEYTFPYTGKFVVRVVYSYEINAPQHIGLRLKNGSNYTDILNFGTSYATFRQNAVYGAELIDGIAGEKLSLEGKVSGSGSRIIGTDETLVGVRTSLEVFGTFAFSGQDVDVSNNLPEMKQIDFIHALQRMFNLVFVPDPDTPKKLKIEPFSDYVGTGSTQHWSDKVDYGMDFVMRPTADLQKKEYQFTFESGQDFISQEVQRSLNRVYGRYRVTDPANDFATGDMKVEVPAAPFVTSLLPGTSFPMHRALQADGTGVQDPQPMFCYWNGLSTSMGTWYLRNDSNTTETYTVFPLFTNYSVENPTLTDLDLNFGSEKPFFPIKCSPRDTLYFKYWAQYVTELYSEESRIVECHVRLTNYDLRTLQFNDTILINSIAYRLLKLEYDATQETMAKATLIKVLTDINVCGKTPTSYHAGSNNLILFQDSNLAQPDYGNQACCELYGYAWTRDKTDGNRCRPKTSSDAPTL